MNTYSTFNKAVMLEKDSSYLTFLISVLSSSVHKREKTWGNLKKEPAPNNKRKINIYLKIILESKMKIKIIIAIVIFIDY
jgi:hypothetical protein